MLPFSHEQFLAVFAEHNTATWPAPLLAYGVGIGLFAIAWLGRPDSGRWVGFGLALLWAWTGAVYHGVFFSRINPLALAFAGAFVLQATLLLVAAGRGALQPGGGRPTRWRKVLGGALAAYALVLYPALGMANGIAYPAAPVFGLTPCPVTLFTWGMLLMARAVPWWLLPVPFAWSLVGGSAAFLLRMPQDALLLASAVCAFLVPRAARPSCRRA